MNSWFKVHMPSVHRFKIIFIFLSLFSFPLHASEWNRLESGLEYRTLEISPFKAILHVFKINPKKFKLSPVVSPPQMPQTVSQMVFQTHALVMVNANFFDGSGKPLGLVIKEGKTLSPFKNISWWGIFGIQNLSPVILHSSEYRPSSNFISGIQAGPRLVVQGKILALKQQVSPKTALGINTQGEVLLMATQDLISTQQLATTLAQPENKGGLGCRDALNLDGGSSTQAYAKIGSFELSLPGFVKIPVGLGVFRR